MIEQCPVYYNNFYIRIVGELTREVVRAQAETNLGASNDNNLSFRQAWRTTEMLSEKFGTFRLVAKNEGRARKYIFMNVQWIAKQAVYKFMPAGM